MYSFQHLTLTYLTTLVNAKALIFQFFRAVLNLTGHIHFLVAWTTRHLQPQPPEDDTFHTVLRSFTLQGM
jgi:hypothetical protein